MPDFDFSLCYLASLSMGGGDAPFPNFEGDCTSIGMCLQCGRGLGPTAATAQLLPNQCPQPVNISFLFTFFLPAPAREVACSLRFELHICKRWVGGVAVREELCSCEGHYARDHLQGPSRGKMMIVSEYQHATAYNPKDTFVYSNDVYMYEH